MIEEFQECCRRSCRWVGLPDDMDRRRDSELSSTLVCPKCGCEEFYKEKPLFIPLKAKFFEGFYYGAKTEEFRKYCSRWNEKTCRIGRRVTISLGYGKNHRLHGKIVGFRIADSAGIPGWEECYGKAPAKVACIKIEPEGGAA